MSEELLKYILAGAVAGYIPLAGFIYFLVKALIKAKDESAAHAREALIQNRELNELLSSVSCVTEKVLTMLTEFRIRDERRRRD